MVIPGLLQEQKSMPGIITYSHAYSTIKDFVIKFNMALDLFDF